jgi:predicted house-cleaning noncanonical NTP pyrophosphatase (MazG superfamily)
LVCFGDCKLVRDKIDKHQISAGTKPHYRKLTNKQHKQELIEKIVEEAQEITHAKPTERASEIADV